MDNNVLISQKRGWWRVVTMKLWLLLLMLALAGCGGAQVASLPEAPLPAPAPAAGQSDQILLEEALRGRAL